MKVLLTVTVEDFYEKFFCKLHENEIIFFCLDKAENSNKVEDGSDWLCIERRELGRERGDTGKAELYTILRTCGGCSPCAIVVDNPRETNAEEIAYSISSCCSSGMELKTTDEIYVEIDPCNIVEEDEDMLFSDPDIFGDNEEHNLLLEFHDGVAIGKGKAKRIVATYPRLERLTEEDSARIFQYSGIKDNGRTFITPRDVCLVFGKLIRVSI